MKKFSLILLLGILWIPLFTQISIAQKKSKKDFLITVSTDKGDIQLILYESTPKHRANFLKLVQEGFYKDLLFHRVIQDFMIQGGDPESKNAKPGQRLGSGGLDYRVDAEFLPELFHKKGALAAARDGNPEKASSSCQFYIVQGKKSTDQELEMIEKRNNITYTEEQKKIYKEVGGTPFLDQNYTVFGEVIAGLDVLDKIADVEKDASDRPKEDVKMNITAKEMSKKKITKLYGYVYE
ncbi:MAG: peptidylprolyl isomerase [Microscillaceae bacterium]|nr:peptidylprolyl isomerase [Microscillaceae bacterium]